MATDSKGRVAVVTGGASGVGRSIAEHLVRAEHRVAVLDVDEGAAGDAAEEICDAGGDAIGVAVDVSERSGVESAFEVVRAKLGSVQILVTSAAVSGFVPFERITLEEWDRTISVNLTGAFHCLQVAMPDMVASGWGRIVTISSAAGQTASPRQAHYSASKGGLIALTRTVAREYAARGITVNTVAPFVVDTPMLRGAQAANYLPDSTVLAKMIPAGRLGTGDDIAATCAFLCSDAGSYITGQVIGVNGGAVL